MAFRMHRGSSSNSRNSDDSSIDLKWRFDVFLSFTGKDTRLNFTDHLHAALQRKGIVVFRDEEGIQRGEAIKQQLLKAIEDSLFAIVVLSQNYAFSPWCLDELQKILEARNELGLPVFPIFYEVDPSDIRYQKGSFGEALAKHDERFKDSKDKEKVQRWRHALTQVADLSGWDSRGCHEANLIEEIVGKIWSDLCSRLPSYNDNLVGIDWRIAKMNLELKMGLDDIRFVGIWGMGGIGKTTLARAVYKRFSTQFDACCFLANVREDSEKEKDGHVQLQKKLISQITKSSMEIWDTDHGKEIIKTICFNKKILLVLDDVNHISQLENLAESPEWFGAGSRVVITTRDMYLLKSHGVHGLYQYEMMNKDESLQLFSNKAFKKDHPEDGYLELSEIVVQYSGGLPLALKTLGSSLYRRSIPEWNDALDRLKQIPNNDIHQILKISYDGLNTEEKAIFLDVACFFNGWDKDEATKVLESCGLHPTIGLSVLIEKSLVMIKKDFFGILRIEMHDLLQELGRHIACEESPRTRLWSPDDINEVLKRNTVGSEAIQVIQLSDMSGLFESNKAHWHSGVFLKLFDLLSPDKKMFNLRLLIGPIETKSFSLCINCLKYLISATKVIVWRDYPLETLPLEDSSVKLVRISLPKSDIKHLWHGVQFLGELKHIDMYGSKRLIETPNFSGVPKLETLDLAVCVQLIKIHPSLGELKKLVRVNLRDCWSLRIIPRKLETNNLTEFILKGCSKVTTLPEFGENMRKLSLLDLKGTKITELPESIGFLTALTHLNLDGCRKLVGHPSTFHNWKLLRTLSMAYCTNFFGPLQDSWSSFHYLTSLIELDLRCCGITDASVLHHIGCLPSLVVLNLDTNSSLSFDLSLDCFSNLLRLRYLFLNNCNMESLPKLPPCLIRIEAGYIISSLGDEQMWDLFSSLDHQRRCGTKYLGRRLTEIESGYHPCRDFVATIGVDSEIASWFPYRLNGRDSKISITVDIRQCCQGSEWSGIVVFLKFTYRSDESYLSWAFKALEDSGYVYKEWQHVISPVCNVCLLVLHCNDETCWQHLRDDNKQLQIQFSCTRGRIEECGWRVLCKQDMIGYCCSKPNDSIVFCPSDSESELWLPDSAVDRTLRFV